MQRGAQFLFLAAINHQKLADKDRAKQFLEQGNAWIRDQCAKDPGADVPRPFAWQDWANTIALQSEATALIRGPGAGPPRK